MARMDPGGATVRVWKPLPPPPVPSVGEGRDSSSSPGVDSQAEDRRDSPSRIRTPRKKPVNTNVWPCKINGCNKQFAREADLKRHQRTTKLHSMPSFACPQCDAAFTRTDALRRHQKSRHDGVVIEVGPSNSGDENSTNGSRSGTPSSKGKERAVNLPVPTHQGKPTHTGPSSYYRTYTETISPYAAPHLQQVPQPSQVALENSSTQATAQWTAYIPNWSHSVIPALIPNMGPISYIPMYPSPHYRPHTTAYSGSVSPVQPSTTTAFLRTPQEAATTGSSSQASTSAIPSRHSSSQPPSSSTSNETVNTDETELTAEDVVAAVEAALLQAASHVNDRDHEDDEHSSRHGSLDNDEDPMGLNDDGLVGMHGYVSILERPEPMEHMMTEDGEPMLNPAELLTQESLASPPPS